MNPQEQNNVNYLDFLKRRKNYILAPFIGVFFISILLAFVLPPIYKSDCTILIESQQIPPDFIRSTVGSFAEQTIKTLTQQIMSRRNLLAIINQLNLYADLRKKETIEEIVEEMRESISLEMIDTQVADKRTGRPSIVTIAFKLSFEGKDPEKVQRVANVLASLYLEENLKNREKKAKTTSGFFEREMKTLNEDITQLETKIAQFKEKHFVALPEMSQINLQTLQRFERDLEQNQQQIKAVRERKIYLQGQLATIAQQMPFQKDRLRFSNDIKQVEARERLALLHTDFLSMKASLSEDHPDVIKMKKIVESLEKEVGPEDDIYLKQRQLQELKTSLKNKTAVFSAQHPDVIKLKKEVSLLEQELAAMAEEKTDTLAVPEYSDNPAYINMSTQIATAVMELESLKKQSISLIEMINNYQKRLELAPQIEMEYNLLTRDYENARNRYRETMNKLMESKSAESLEREQIGEKFTIIEPGMYPEEPHKPNRLALILTGFILALGAGVGCASIKEFTDQSFRSELALANLTNKPVLANISLIETSASKRKKRYKTIVIVVTIFIIIFLGALLIHLFVIRLDILWFKILDYLF